MKKNADQKHLVSVITPVFNGLPYLQECIESVLRQTHGNFEYIIADNRSTDDSLNLARSYAERDTRIRVVSAEEHVGPIQNWNRSLSFVNPDAEYIKFVHADDWIYPDCLEKMVDAALSCEDTGIVSAYRLEEDRVSLDRLPRCYSSPDAQRRLSMEGHEVIRATFNESASVLGSPSSILFTRKALEISDPFFDESYLHADKEACIRILKRARLAFVREVLTFTRRHNESVTSRTNVLDTRRQDDLIMLAKHGRSVMSPSEFQKTLSLMLRLYYYFLARSCGSGKGSEFWRSHRAVFAKAGLRFSRWRVLGSLIRFWLNPVHAFRHVREQRKASKGLSASSASQYASEIRQVTEDIG